MRRFDPACLAVARQSHGLTCAIPNYFKKETVGTGDEKLDDAIADDQDRNDSIAAAHEQQEEGPDNPDTYEQFKEAEADAMESAADEGQIFHKD